MNENSENKICKSCKKEFEITQDDFNFFKKIDVPPPTWCPHCRFVRKLTFINQRLLYKSICGYCKKSIISMYDSKTPFPVWCVKCHLSDVWDGRDYGIEYDFSKTFFEQFKELKYSIPHRSLDQNERNGEGCDYSNLCYTSKDVYLSFDTIASEHIKYSSHVFKLNKNCMDSLLIKANDKGYELVQAISNYNSSFLIESDQCIESHFLYDCTNCVNCCLSSNLRNKSNVFMNKQLSKEEYKKAIAEIKLDTYSGQSQAKKEFEALVRNSIHRFAHIKNSVNSTGDFLENAKNCINCYGVEGSENLKNCFFSMNSLAHDSQDLIMTGSGSESYECTNSGRGMNRVVLSFSCGSGCSEVYYCDGCRGCTNCFGCVSLINKKYCIFNKQYTKEEYFELIEKIKKHMDEMPYVDKIGRVYGYGECFPAELSSFAYNESSAFDEEPFSKEEVLAQGYKWREREPRSYVPTIQVENLPESIRDVSDSICEEIIECLGKGKEALCTLAFRILPDELTFYRQMNLPVPRYCPNCRYYDRRKWINPFKFYSRECMCELEHHRHGEKCEVEFETMYAPNRPEIIYCKDCYQKEFL